jgi:hypothetical protein
MRVLEMRVVKGERESIRLALRLRSLTDGDCTERLDQMLGNAVKSNPAAFLDELSDNRQDVARLDALLRSLGPVFADRQREKQKEWSRRVIALRTVTRPQLIGIRDSCIAILKKP